MKTTTNSLKSFITVVFALCAVQVMAQNELKVALIFGAQSAQCANTGICHMYVMEDVAESNTFDALGTFTLKGDEATLTVDYSSMNAETLGKQFSNITFVMAERFVLPTEILAEKGWPATTIVMGEYEYEQLDNTMIVYFHSLQH